MKPILYTMEAQYIVKIQQENVQRQSLNMAQTTIQACNILSMGLEEVYDFIKEISMENPLISFESIPYITPYARGTMTFTAHEASIGFADELSESNDLFGCESRLKAFLRLQIPVGLDAQSERIVRYVIDCLDDDGYLSESDLDISMCLGCSESAVDKALLLVHEMEPKGVGARNLRECLLLQLEHNTIERLIIKNYFEQFLKNQPKTIARKLGVEVDDVCMAFENIKRLDPKPCREYDERVARYIIPDVNIDCQNGAFSITLNRDFTPELQIDELYEGSIYGTTDKTARDWLNEKRQQAILMKKLVQKRNSTLLLVCREIFDFQKPFFYKGPEYLRPLKQRQIAQSLQCHESTIYRAVKGKYLSCKWGIFPLDYFFSNKIDCQDECESCNPKTLIIDIIECENKSEPLSDQQIADKLILRGIQISRRTVAKYREYAGIPAALKRKKYI